MMTEELLETMRAEGLDKLNWVMGDDRVHRRDAVALVQRAGIWLTFSTDERAAVVETSIRTYESHSAALDDFLRLLRMLAEEKRLTAVVRERSRLAREARCEGRTAET